MFASKIIGTGKYLPLVSIPNEAIVFNSAYHTKEQAIDWVDSKLGIRNRRIVLGDESTADLCFYAGKNAIESSGLDRSDIDLVIVGTITPSRPAPSTACEVIRRLEINAPAFDLAAVCSGFYYGMVVADQFIKTGMYKNILVIGGDVFSKITNWESRDCVFFGDGAGAIVMSRRNGGEGKGFITSHMYADGNDGHAFYIPAGGSRTPITTYLLGTKENCWFMDKKKVYDQAVEVLPKAITRAVKEAGVTLDDIKYIIPHQPSITVLRDVAKKLNIPFSKILTNMKEYANTGAGTIPILLRETVEKNMIEDGDLIIFAAIGAGWTWGAGVYRW